MMTLCFLVGLAVGAMIALAVAGIALLTFVLCQKFRLLPTGGQQAASIKR
jgi:hypothetical protein